VQTQVDFTSKGTTPMADQRTIIDEIAVKDLEDGSILKVTV
jgi:hypothetical protein